MQYLTVHGRREGMRRIFTSVKAFIQNSPRMRGRSGPGTTFHATLTYVWAHLVHYAIASMKAPAGKQTFTHICTVPHSHHLTAALLTMVFILQ